ncbi:MAG: alpha/beta hydrolase [Patescibacteria group bacterium]
MEKKTIIIAGRSVSYLVSPGLKNDQTIVFLPGWKSPVDLFCSVMGDMPNLLAVNFPGWPGSEAPDKAWGLAEYADFLKTFLEKINIRPAILIAHSVGAAIAIEYLSRGGQAKKLILVDGAVIREKSGKANALFVGAKIFRFLFPFVGRKWRQRLGGKLLSVDYREAGELEKTYKRLITEDRQAFFRALDLPIAMVWGQDDQDTPLDQARRLERLRPQTALEIIPGAGHYCFLDKPREFKAILAKLLWI